MHGLGSLARWLLLVLVCAHLLLPEASVNEACKRKRDPVDSGSCDGAAWPGEKAQCRTGAAFGRLFDKWKGRPAFECHAAPSRKHRGDRRADKTRLRIASFNAEWLFAFGDRVRCPGAQCTWPDLAAAREHFVLVAQLVAKLDADMLHLNEVEDCRALGLLMDLLPRGHGYRGYLVRGTDEMTGQNVGLLTRIDPSQDLERSEGRAAFPVAGSSCRAPPPPASQESLAVSFQGGAWEGRASGWTGLSKHYFAEFRLPLTVPGGPAHLVLVLTGAHLLSQPGHRLRCLRREGQAHVWLQGMRERARSAAQRHPHSTHEVALVATGDLNDYDPDVASPDHQASVSQTLPILTQQGGLVNAAHSVPGCAARYTNWHDVDGDCADSGAPEHGLIDHLLFTEGMRTRLRRAWIVNDAVDADLWVSCTRRISDHWPIVAEFAL